ncbi:hypothetical protein Tco_0497637 [Tanacetum coccineum]
MNEVVVSIRRFMKRWDEEHITVWNCPNGIKVQVQGRAEVLTIVLLNNNNNRLIKVNGRLPWGNVLRHIRGSFGMLDGAELTLAYYQYDHPLLLTVMTDIDYDVCVDHYRPHQLRLHVTM